MATARPPGREEDGDDEDQNLFDEQLGDHDEDGDQKAVFEDKELLEVGDCETTRELTPRSSCIWAWSTISEQFGGACFGKTTRESDLAWQLLKSGGRWWLVGAIGSADQRLLAGDI